jgi:DNA-binding NtrC family response regulator
VSSEKKPRAKPQEDAPRILVADDEPHIVEALRMLLRSEGFQVLAASAPAEVLATLNSEPLDAVLIDANYARDTTSGAEGLALLDEISRRDANLPVILMTAWGSIELAVAAMRGGARDFVQKPCSLCFAPRSSCEEHSTRLACWKQRTLCCAQKSGRR